ncbi:MAG: hypothetical protein QN157_08780 [Armatimonadota bacterium]|nr:hypothetical protein [Armatimonadota bacterium]
MTQVRVVRGAIVAGRRRAMRGGAPGAALLSVVVFLLLILMVTVGVMAVVRSDLAAGIRQQQAVQVFNVAEAGVHYAIARLQTEGADRYEGETVPITDGNITIGTATVEVRCLDGSRPGANACAAVEPAYRRIISTGTLTVPEPRRVVTVVVEGTTSVTRTYAVCAYDGLTLDQQVTIYGAVGSNGTITLSGPSTSNRAAICDSAPDGPGLGGRCGTPNPTPVNEFTSDATAVGAITCNGGGCPNQVEGHAKPNQPAGSVCPTVALPSWGEPGATPLSVPRGSTVIANPAMNYGAVTLEDTPGNPSSCPSDPAQRATLVLDAGSDPNATVTFQMRTLQVGKCARVEIRGQGKVELRLLEPSGTALRTVQRSVLGTKSQVLTAEEPVEGHRFTVKVVSTSGTAVDFNQSGLIAGTFIVPNGGFHLDQAQITNGAILAKAVDFDQGTTFTWDPRSVIGDQVYGNFRRLRAWKDQ